MGEGVIRVPRENELEVGGDGRGGEQSVVGMGGGVLKKFVKTGCNRQIHNCIAHPSVRVEVLDPTGISDTKILHLNFGCAVGPDTTNRESCLGKDRVEKRAEPETAFDVSRIDYNYNASFGIHVIFFNWTEPKKFRVSP